MNTEFLYNIINAELNGALIMLMAVFAFFFYIQYSRAEREGLKRIAIMQIITGCWILLLYLLDILDYIPGFLELCHQHRITHLSVNLIVMPLCLITLSLQTKRWPFSYAWVTAHIVPFVVCAIVGIFTNNMWVYTGIVFASLVYGMYFLIAITRAAIRYERAAQNEYSSLEGRSFKWLISLPIMMSLLMPTYLIYIYTKNIVWLIVYQVLSIVLWWLYFNSSLRMIIERNLLRINLDSLDEEMLEEDDNERPEGYENVNVNENQDENQDDSFVGRLKRVCEDEMLYLRDDLTREELAQALMTNHTYLTKQLQAELGMNFYTYINGLRIAYAKELLKQHPDWAMEQVAIESGYRNKTTFYNAFQRIADCTPVDWKKSIISQ